MGSDRNSSNDYADEVALHDLPPTPSQPSATGSTTFERGDSVQFETSALPNDLIDDIYSMTPQMEYSRTGENTWGSSWISDPVMEGSGANTIYVHTIQTPPNADSGKYDTRVSWEDAAGQQSEWLVTSEAFELRNALPRVLNNNDAGFVGTPTVKIDATETVSLVGLVSDAETPLSMLSITSSDPEFKGWNSATSQITVLFDSILEDSTGNPIPQGISISIDDGEDVNNGLLLFNVIENGAPRWSPIPTQAVFEGGSASTILTGFLSDTDENGEPVSPSDLSLSIVSNSNEELVYVSISGQTLTAITANEDFNGVAEVIVMADDGAKSSQTSVVFFVINVNDAPEANISSLEGMTLKSGEQVSIGILPLISDVDDPDEEIWVDVDTSIPGSAQFDHINGVLNMMWEEPGEHNVKLTLIDSHGDWSSSQFIVTILDAKPLSWGTDFDQGDLDVILEDFALGNNPTVTISYSGTTALVDPEVRWSICNGIVGICHSAGLSDGLGPFMVTSSSGSGLSMGDYLTLSVKAVDSDGWDRSTPEQMDILVPTTNNLEPAVPEVEDDDDTSADQQSSSGDSGISSIEIVVAILILMVFIGGGTMAGLYFSGAIGRDRKEESKPPYSAPQHFSQPQHEETVDFEQQEEIHPPLPEGGLPSGWTMEQWKYYGEEYLERQK